MDIRLDYMFSFNLKKKFKGNESVQQAIPNEIAEWLGGIEIHKMPDKFLSVRPTKSGSGKKKFMWILWIVVSFVVLGLVGAALFVFYSKPDPQELENKNVDNMVLDLDTETDDTISGSLYGDNLIDSTQEDLGSLNNEEISEESDGVNPQDKLSQDQEQVDASLDEQEGDITESNNDNIDGLVDLGEEVVDEARQVSLDTDGDGLTDVEESIFSTSITSSDTDLDGYDDGAEVLALYDPSQPSQGLRDSNLIREFINSVFGYSVLFPRSWSVTSFDTDQRHTLFQSLTGESFEVLVIDNTSGISDSRLWFIDQYPFSAPDEVHFVDVNGMQGVMTKDNLSLYIVTEKLAYMISYNVGSQSLNSYETTFQMFINSLQIFENPL